MGGGVSEPEFSGSGTIARTLAQAGSQGPAGRAHQSEITANRSRLFPGIPVAARVRSCPAYLFSRSMAEAEAAKAPADQRAISRLRGAGFNTGGRDLPAHGRRELF